MSGVGICDDETVNGVEWLFVGFGVLAVEFVEVSRGSFKGFHQLMFYETQKNKKYIHNHSKYKF